MAETKFIAIDLGDAVEVELPADKVLSPDLHFKYVGGRVLLGNRTFPYSPSSYKFSSGDGRYLEVTSPFEPTPWQRMTEERMVRSLYTRFKIRTMRMCYAKEPQPAIITEFEMVLEYPPVITLKSYQLIYDNLSLVQLLAGVVADGLQEGRLAYATA